MLMEKQEQAVGSIITIELHQDDRGYLTTIQAHEDVPFEIKRVYSIFNVPEGAVRGCHAHRTEKQLLVCLNGRCAVTLDDGSHKTEYMLDNPLKGLLIDQVIWRTMTGFSNDCVLTILSDSRYDPDDYVYDYESFRDLVNGKDNSSHD